MPDKEQVDPTWSRRRHVIGVMGSGSDPHDELAVAAGRVIARLDCHLLTGGGAGVMLAASRAFKAATKGALSIGVLRAEVAPRDDERPPLGFRPRRPNPFVDLPVFTHLPSSSTALDSRNHINVLTADALVFLPGGAGTLSELELASAYDWVHRFLFLSGGRIAGRSEVQLRRDFPTARFVSDEATLERGLRDALGSSSRTDP